MEATDGNFCEATAYGGSNSNCYEGAGGCGTAFKIPPPARFVHLFRRADTPVIPGFRNGRRC